MYVCVLTCKNGCWIVWGESYTYVQALYKCVTSIYGLIHQQQQELGQSAMMRAYMRRGMLVAFQPLL